MAEVQELDQPAGSTDGSIAIAASPRRGGGWRHKAAFALLAFGAVVLVASSLAAWWTVGVGGSETTGLLYRAEPFQEASYDEQGRTENALQGHVRWTGVLLLASVALVGLLVFDLKIGILSTTMRRRSAWGLAIASILLTVFLPPLLWPPAWRATAMAIGPNPDLRAAWWGEDRSYSSEDMLVELQFTPGWGWWAACVAAAIIVGAWIVHERASKRVSPEPLD